MSAIDRKPEHSVLGASSAERWLNCPGSNVLIKKLDLPPSDDTDFAKEGTAAHMLAAVCLQKECDTWEYLGEKFNGVEVDQEMADAVQMYLSTIRELISEHEASALAMGLGIGDVQHRIEERVSDSSISDHFYGTADDVIDGPAILDITDLKYGVGIAVDAIDNPQLKYYAVGVLARTIGARRVRLRIVQPRAFHHEGPIREWETTADELLKWRDEVLKPAMINAEFDQTLTPGEWCRFCPAKLVCPMLTALYEAMVKADPSKLVNLTDAQLGMNYTLVAPAMMYRKAIEEETFKRLSHGKVVPGAKLVPKKSNRVFVATVPEPAGDEMVDVPIADIMRRRFGKDAFTEPELKSPAQIATMGPAGKSFVKEFAYSPNTGLTVALTDDPRIGVTVQNASEAFAAYKGPTDAAAS